jgi:hypothetical protein
MHKRLLVPILGAALLGGAAAGAGLTAFAAAGPANGAAAPTAFRGGAAGPGVSGTVTAVNGSSITVSGKDGGTYTIDASGASVEKYANGTTSTVSVSAIAVGDIVMISGRIETATISAKEIRDGVRPAPPRPVAVGKVTAISGSAITLSGMARPSLGAAPAAAKPAATSYTVDASNATITKMSAPPAKGQAPASTTISVSQIAVGDELVVQGTANGSAIAASSITDGGAVGARGGFGPRTAPPAP